jgi:hypothetical protein
MTIDELIERLEDYRDALGGDAEVRLMTQQNWPFENEIFGVATLDEIREHDGEEDFDPEGVDDAIYIVEGHQLGYGTSAAWAACR